MTDGGDDTPGAGAFGFTGRWQEYAPIAFTNLLLTIVTLGLYSFWATARTRRYLWSRTRFIDERLEWTGTGLELFIGYLLVLGLFFLPLVLLQFGLQGLVLRGHNGLAALLTAVFYVAILWVVGVAVFRALRYRLSRTYWRGIRGGSDDNGFGYGVQYIWRTVVGAVLLGLAVPWAMTSLWNRRWNAMSFGPLRFSANAGWKPLMGRYLLIYVGVIALVFALGAVMATMFAAGLGRPGDDASPALVLPIVLVLIGFYVVVPLIVLAYYAAYFREAVGRLALGSLEFGFTARTKDWLLLFLGNVALVIVTLGIGAIFIAYRNWSFFVRHMEAYGTINADDLTQSTTRAPGQGEGLLDAFDVGAF